MAGRLVVHEGALHRFGQDSGSTYGHQVGWQRPRVPSETRRWCIMHAHTNNPPTARTLLPFAQVVAFRITSLTPTEFSQTRVPFDFGLKRTGPAAWNGVRHHHVDAQQVSERCQPATTTSGLKRRSRHAQTAAAASPL